jgi:hypothetical protein
MLFKDGRGQVLEDVDQYDVLCRIMNNMKTKQNLSDRAVTHKESRIETDISHGAEYMKGKTVIHELHSGVLGASQDFLIPVSALTTVAGYAFQLEHEVRELVTKVIAVSHEVIKEVIKEVLPEIQTVIPEVPKIPEVVRKSKLELVNGFHTLRTSQPN